MAVHKDDAVNITTAGAVEKPTIKPPGRLKRFLREVMTELKKTNWPSRDELTKFTVVVMVTIIVVAVLLFVYDTVAAHVMQYVGIVPKTAGQ